MYLHRVRCRVEGGIAGIPFGQASFLCVAHALVLQPSRPQIKQPGNFDPLHHEGDHLLYQLILSNGPTKGLPLVGVTHRRFQAGLNQPRGSGGDGIAPVVQGTHGDFKPFTLVTQEILGWHGDVVQGDGAGVAGAHPQLAVDGAGR